MAAIAGLLAAKTDRLECGVIQCEELLRSKRRGGGKETVSALGLRLYRWDTDTWVPLPSLFHPDRKTIAGKVDQLGWKRPAVGSFASFR